MKIKKVMLEYSCKILNLFFKFVKLNANYKHAKESVIAWPPSDTLRASRIGARDLSARYGESFNFFLKVYIIPNMLMVKNYYIGHAFLL